MSVILDALKRAEGERELVYVPTPTTIHEEIPRTKRRALPWIMACALLTSTAGVLLVWVDPPARMDRPSTDAEPRAISSPSADGADIAREQPSQRGIQKRSSPSTQDIAEVTSREFADVTRPSSPRARVAVPARAAGLPDPQQTEARGARPRVRGSARQQDAPPHAAAPGPATSAAPVPDRAVSAPIVPPLTGNAENRVDLTPPPPQSVSTPRTDTPPSRLHEALAKMTLNVLVYSEDAAERRVFIGGHRYVEGDRVDGLFLVKEIRPEGVLLSRQGEQALLRLSGRSR
jgi:general secretion pathway protein B